MSVADNGHCGLAGKGAWPVLCGEEMRTGMGCSGLGWEEGAAVVCESAGIQLLVPGLAPGLPALTGASCLGSLSVACVQSPVPFLLVTHALSSPVLSALPTPPTLGPCASLLSPLK